MKKIVRLGFTLVCLALVVAAVSGRDVLSAAIEKCDNVDPGNEDGYE